MNKINLYVRTCLSLISEQIFGARVTDGEPITKSPTFRSYYPSSQPSEAKWIKEVHFGRMYNKTKDKFFDR